MIGFLSVIVLLILIYQFRKDHQEKAYNTIHFKARYLGSSMTSGYWREGIYDLQVSFQKNEVIISDVTDGKTRKNYRSTVDFAKEWEVVSPNKMVRAFCDDWEIPISEK